MSPHLHFYNTTSPTITHQLAVQLIQDQNVLATKLNKLQKCNQQLDEEIFQVQDEVSKVKMAVQQEEERYYFCNWFFYILYKSQEPHRPHTHGTTD